MDDKKFYEFKTLFKKFIDGTRWLNERMAEGINVDQDKKDFQRLVVEPMDKMWATFTDEEKKYWDAVDRAVKTFDGRIM
jgi:hypothetical protein